MEMPCLTHTHTRTLYSHTHMHTVFLALSVPMLPQYSLSLGRDSMNVLSEHSAAASSKHYVLTCLCRRQL